MTVKAKAHVHFHLFDNQIHIFNIPVTGLAFHASGNMRTVTEVDEIRLAVNIWPLGIDVIFEGIGHLQYLFLGFGLVSSEILVAGHTSLKGGKSGLGGTISGRMAKTALDTNFLYMNPVAVRNGAGFCDSLNRGRTVGKQQASDNNTRQ